MELGSKPRGSAGAGQVRSGRTALADVWDSEPSTDPSASESLFALFAESVQDYAIFMLDASGTVISWSKGAHLLKGYSAEEIIGKHFSVFYPSDDQAAGKPTRALQRALELGRSEDEGWRVRKDGTRFYAHGIITPLWDDSHRLRGFGRITHELTERRQSEERHEERHYAERIARLEADALEEKRKAEQALEEAMRVRDDFLSMASHELNTPLTPMKLQLARLLHNLPSPEKTVAHLRSLMRQTDRLAHIVAELLDVSRIASGRMSLELEPTDLTSVVRDVVSRFTPPLGPSQGEIVLHVVPSIVGRWDPVRLDQVVSNLVSNALKFGSGKPIEVSLRCVGTSVCLEVRDHGIGIAPEDQKRIFERFERAVSSQHFGGFGLGLWIVRQIVEALHGSVRVASTPSEGTTFTVQLPMEQRDGA